MDQVRSAGRGKGKDCGITGMANEKTIKSNAGDAPRSRDSEPTEGDIAETLQQAGLAASTASGLDIMPHTSADISDTMRAFGIKPSRPVMPMGAGPKSGTGGPATGPATGPAMRGPIIAPEIRTTAEISNAAPAPPDLGIDLQQQIVRGMPIVGPLMDKATAALGAGIQPLIASGNVPATFGERYSRNLARIVGEQEQYAKENPVKSTIANLVGGGLLLGPVAGTRAGGLALGTYGPSLGSRVLTGSIGGGGIGVADAALRNENPATGGIIGTVGGVAGPLVGKAIESGVNAIGSLMRPRVGALGDVSEIALKRLTGAMEGETPASLVAARERMGPAGFASDINPAMTDLAGGVADIPGPGKAVVREAYRTRAAQQGERIDKALTDATGTPRTNIEDFKTSIMENRKAAADPLYEQWRTTQVHPTDKLKELMPRLEKAGAFDMAEELSHITGEPISRNFFTGGTKKDFPTAQAWDYVKQGLDRRIDAAYSAGDKTLGRALVNLRHEMIDEIEKTSGGKVWKQARSEFASHSTLLDQVAAGHDTFLGARSGLTVDELRNELKGLSAPELKARIVGLRNAADQAMGDTVRGDTTLRNKILAPNNQEKMRLLLGDAKAEKLIQSMHQEKYLGDQAQNIVGGSQTTPKKERIGALLPGQMPDWNPNLAQPLTWLPPSWIDQMRPSHIIDAWRGQQHGQAVNQLASLLTTREGPQLDNLLSALTQETRRRGGYASRAAAARDMVSGLVSGPVTTTARRDYLPAQ
jgi:hypothetical protein